MANDLLTLGSILNIHTVVRGIAVGLTSDPVHPARAGRKEPRSTDAVEVTAGPWWSRWISSFMPPEPGANEKANSVRALAGRRTTWTGLCRAIVADVFVQMVHIPLVVLWVRNALPRDGSRPWKQGPT